MKKTILALASVALLPAFSFADQNNIGSCGWGSRVFRGERGIFPQILAVTTNGTSGNQTFAITSGTSGCTQDGVVSSAWKTAAYMDGNLNRVARDMSSGRGESLESLASLLEIDEAKKPLFFSVTKENFARIFPRSDVSSPEVLASLSSVLNENAELAQYSSLL